MVSAGTLFEAIGSATSGVFSKSFGFLLNDVITPIIVVILVVLFIWGQYKLVQFYVYLGKVVLPYIIKLIQSLARTERGKKVLEPLLNKFEMFTTKSKD